MTDETSSAYPRPPRGYAAPVVHRADAGEGRPAQGTSLPIAAGAPPLPLDGALCSAPSAARPEAFGPGAVQAPPAAHGRAPEPPAAACVPPAPVRPEPLRPPAAGAGAPKRRRVWPWLLLGIAVGFLFGCLTGTGCTACMVGNAYYDIHGGLGSQAPEGSDGSDGGAQPYGWSHPYGHDFGGSGEEGSELLDDGSEETFTYRQILGALPFGSSSVEGDAKSGSFACTPGAYQVGTLSGIPAGTYFLEGSDTAESRYFVFEAVGKMADPSKTLYRLRSTNVYLGDHFVSLSAGDLIVYLPADEDDRMRDESDALVVAGDPLRSGLYRVGVDIPQGTYRLLADPDLSDTASMEVGAYVMSASSFATGTVVDERFVTVGSNQTVTVRDGDWLELYGTLAVLEGQDGAQEGENHGDDTE